MSKKENRRIGSFVVLDLEASTYDGDLRKLSIMELTMYGFPAKDLQTDPIKVTKTSEMCVPPPSPNLNKLTLIINPRKVIYPKSAASTGLDNYILEHESHFDENCACLIVNFLNRLPQPVCLVAHNGDRHDFLIVKNMFNKLSMQLPNNILYVDSLHAFWRINFDHTFQTTPNGKYPPKGVYKLNNIYKQNFKKDPELRHHAEADVETLTHVIRLYGKRFLAYAEDRVSEFICSDERK
ncbi:three-prime repair exonuclease 1-like [Bactrocera tryoni]|uniref:three-prime repair exonuclease 1-like n=1 Tax=Bactrocera tryoni TaxID=59916 RepID=UPI001A978A0A|nr:three-prime repair exonuclease 1-like [Bactrocera tryoni]